MPWWTTVRVFTLGESLWCPLWCPLDTAEPALRAENPGRSLGMSLKFTQDVGFSPVAGSADKREVGSSTLPRPIPVHQSPAWRLSPGGADGNTEGVRAVTTLDGPNVEALVRPFGFQAGSMEL
jgi:hypothetical protein